PVRPLPAEQRDLRRDRDDLESLSLHPWRLRVRAAPLPPARAPLHARARDADDPGPDAPRAGLQAARGLPVHALEPDRDVPGLHPDPPAVRDQPLPDAPVLPDDSEGLRGGGEARQRRLLQDLLASDAAARGTR